MSAGDLTTPVEPIGAQSSISACSTKLTVTHGETEAVAADTDDEIHISDVIEVIATDPDFLESCTDKNNMYSQRHSPNSSNHHQLQNTEQQQSTLPPTPSPNLHHAHLNTHIRETAFVRILEQPASKALRFRYKCEGRSAGSIPGANSTPENKTFPTIEVVGYRGRAHVVVSCVTKEPPYRAHPHNLVGREGCKRGVCSLDIPTESMSIAFSNLGIQCVKRNEIDNELRLRQEINVDPFQMSFAHRSQPTSIDLNAVRLCFQVFLPGTDGRFSVALNPIVSEPIFDKKAMSDLIIVKLSHCNCLADGGRHDIILLCEKVAKEDIQVRFFEEKDNVCIWEAFGDFQPSQVHKQTAIYFRPPKYRQINITEPVKVLLQLRRPSDGALSEALPFEFLPLDVATESGVSKRKRQKFDERSQFLKQLEEYDRNRHQDESLMYNIPVPCIKAEPRDKSPSPFYGDVKTASTVTVSGTTYYGGAGPGPGPAPTDSQRSVVYQTHLMGATPTTSIGYNFLSPHTGTGDNSVWSGTAPNSNAPSPATSEHTVTNYSLGMTGGAHAPTATADGGAISSLLDLDSQLMFDTNNLSESFTNNLSLSDLEVAQSMSGESLSRLATSTINDMMLFKDE